MDKRKIIMDVDTGTDDAVALVMAMLDEHFDLLGITAVNGNLEVKLTTANSLSVVECCGKQNAVKVYKGCDYPIASTLLPDSEHRRRVPRREGMRTGETEVHQERMPLPLPVTREADESAVVWLISTLLAHADGEVTLVPVGPLTNIAVAMRADPRIIPKIKEIVIMGGGHEISNASFAAEFNVWCDPEAMEIVTQAGCKVTMVPLDATHIAYITQEEAERIRAVGTKPAALIADVIEQRIKGYAKDADMQAVQGAPIHDAVALCAVLYPQVLQNVLHVTMHTDISRGFAYGRTIIDTRTSDSAEAPNTYFALGADKQFFYNWMLEVLEKDKANRTL